MSEGNNAFGAARLKQVSRVSEIIGTRATPAATQKIDVEEKRDANISANVFYKTIFDTSLSPDEKQQQVAKELATIGTKEENRIRVQQLEQIKEYLQLQREKMASSIISITDTDVMARLQQVYSSMNTSMIDFNESIKPILDIVEAMNVVRKEGKTADLFLDIRNDRRDEQAIKDKKGEIENRFSAIKNTIDSLNVDIAHLQEEKTLFGFGGIKKEAQQEINVKLIQIDEANTQLRALETELTTINAEIVQSTNDETDFGKAKKTIREMLDLSANDHKENQKKTVEKALDFVKTSKSSLNDIKGHLVGLNGQIDNLTDANHTMLTAYAILGEGMKDAEKEIVEKRGTVAQKVEGESKIATMQRDDVLRTIDEHTTMLSSSASDTELTFADLTSQASRIATMKSANKGQMDKVQKLSTSAVAGTADRLSVVLQAVGAAALGESSEIARETLVSMNDTTNEIALRESMRVAFGTQEVNADIMKAMEDLSAYAEVTKAATSITQESVSEMRQNLDQLKDIANSLQDDLKAQGAVYSEASGASVKPVAVDAVPTSNDPFKL
jgi:hypothetical protein